MKNSSHWLESRSHNIIIITRCKDPLQEGQEKDGYSRQLPEELSENLNRKCGKGFSASNLKLFRKFYPAYPERVPVTREQEISAAAGLLMNWVHSVYLIHGI